MPAGVLCRQLYAFKPSGTMEGSVCRQLYTLSTSGCVNGRFCTLLRTFGPSGMMEGYFCQQLHTFGPGKLFGFFAAVIDAGGVASLHTRRLQPTPMPTQNNPARGGGRPRMGICSGERLTTLQSPRNGLFWRGCRSRDPRRSSFRASTACLSVCS